MKKENVYILYKPTKRIDGVWAYSFLGCYSSRDLAIQSYLDATFSFEDDSDPPKPLIVKTMKDSPALTPKELW